MSNLTCIEIKAFVPAKDFETSKRFYRDAGFEQAWSDEHLAYFRLGDCSFLLQNFYRAEHAANFMMHLLVEDADSWWEHVQRAELASKYGVHTEPPKDQPWGLRDFVLVDPTGVLWRVGQNIRNATATERS